MKKNYAIMALLIILSPLGAGIYNKAAANEVGNNSHKADPLSSIGEWQTTITWARPARPARRAPHSIGRRNQKIAALRTEAMKTSMKHLPRLRPYTSDYPRMVRAVQDYWRKNITHPNAARLTNIIMRHVRSSYRFFVRPKVRNGINDGVKELKRKLPKS